MDLTLDYFSNFAISRGFKIDTASVATSYRQLQQAYHPDRFANASDEEQRVAVQTAAYLNQAHSTLQSPLKRAIYLLELEGMEPLSPTNTHLPKDFLLQQMSLRERMEDIETTADIEAAIETLAGELAQLHKDLQNQFSDAYAAQLWLEAETQVRKLQFIDKLIRELNDLQGRLLD